jgi:hypothetical protein
MFQHSPHRRWRICPTTSWAWRTPVGKSQCPGSVQLLQRLHWWWKAPFECPLQSRAVEVTGRQVRTVGAWPRHSQPKVAIWLTVAAPMWDLASSNTIVRPSRNCWHNHRTICVDMMSGPYTSTRWLWMLAGYALFCCPAFNTALRWHRLHMKVVHPTTNEEGCLWTQNTVTPHQFYAVPRNKMGKLIFRLSSIWNSNSW